MKGVPVLLLDPSDDVVVLLDEAGPGSQLDLPSSPGCHLVAKERIPFGHKVAVRDLASGSPVHKYGATIGLTSRPVVKGGHVHTHNLKSVRAPEGNQ